MRCKFCGAEVKEGASACEYCGSEVERHKPYAQTVIKDNKKPYRSIIGIICKGIIILACIWAVVIIISLIVVLNSDVFKTYYVNQQSTYTNYGIPKNEKKLTGQIISCDKNGVASGFFIMAKEEGRYLAIRDSHVISFTSEIPLEEEGYYIGYFSYPDMCLYSVEEESPFSMTYMDPKCEDKESVVVKEFYTGEEITVYKIMVMGEWYYCSKSTYDTIQIDDMLSEYEMYPNQDPAFITRSISK